MLQFICVDTYFITDYGVFCGINAGLFKQNRIVYRPQHCGRWNHPTQVSSLQKGEECSDGGDSSALWGQTLLCSGIVFALESEVPGSNLGAGTDSALGTTIGDEDGTVDCANYCAELTSNFRSIEVCRYTSCSCVFNVKSAAKGHSCSCAPHSSLF